MIKNIEQYKWSEHWPAKCANNANVIIGMTRQARQNKDAIYRYSLDSDSQSDNPENM